MARRAGESGGGSRRDAGHRRRRGRGKITIEPWDYRYYAEKVRQAKYDLDSDEVKQYLQLDKLREAMFFVAGELFGFEFTPLPEGTVPGLPRDVGSGRSR